MSEARSARPHHLDVRTALVGRVRMPDELEGVWGKVEALAHQLPYPHDGVGLTVPGPQGDSILLGADAHDDSCDVVDDFRVFVLSYHHHRQFNKRGVQLLAPLVVQIVGPLSPVLVGIVFPHGFDARAEQVVVAAEFEFACVLNVVE